MLAWGVFAATATAQLRPAPDGSDRHPSDLRFPLNTWEQRESASFLLRPPDYPTVGVGTVNKLQSIVIPQIEFRNTTLQDAVEFLRQESRRLDPDPNPETRGVNIVLRPTKFPPDTGGPTEPIPGLPSSDSLPPAPADSATRITLTMRRLPLIEALRYVASQSNLKVIVEPDAVSIVPFAYAIQALTSAQYEVPPQLLGRPVNTSLHPPPADLQGWFEARGIVFPPGSSAVYEPFTRKLIVSNTPENLDKIVSVISSALKPADPTTENP